jgi:Fe2+ transport system protein FeoA
MTLLEAIKNTNYTVTQVLTADGVLSSRLYKLGFYPGATIFLRRKAPLFMDPLLFQVGESQIALTKTEAKLIEISIK